MPPISLFTLKILGPTLAKALLASFNIPSKLTNEIATAAIDTTAGELLKPAVSSATLTKKVDEMAGRMVEDIRPLFVGEGRSVDTGSQNAIVLGLSETLLKVRLTQAGLAEMNFDRGALTQHLLKANLGVDRDFSAGEKALYRQAVGIVSDRLIEAAPNVEGFALSTAFETLRRLEDIAKQLGFERDREIQAADEFVGHYRQVVQDELNALEIFGHARTDDLTSQQSLSMAYITLSVMREAGEEEEESARFGRGKFGRLTAEPKQLLSRVDGALCDCRRVVIRGSAGTGKSTLMQWLAVKAAKQSFEGKLADWNSKIPFFIRLRNLVGGQFPTPEKFPVMVAPNFAAVMPEGWVHKYLNRGQALVLIDGVDELPRQERGDFLKALKALVRDFPNATYVVTSRPSGLKSMQNAVWQAWENWVSTQKFVTLTLEPMNAANVEEFVTRWHNALPTGDPASRLDRDPAQSAQNLNRQLRQRPELQRLAATPLLCSMICALHRERLETLPSSRLTLYSECIDVLLNRRDGNEGRAIPLDETYPIGLNEDQKIELLQSLAWKLMQLNLSSLETNRVDSHFDRELKQTSLPTAITGKQIRELFVDRAALLREPIVGQVDFAHRTFQEYLAAQAILDDDSLEVLIDKAADDQWREVIIAAVGLARPKEREKLLNSLVERGDREAENQKYLHLLAVACLETATKVRPEIREYVLAGAKASMPPKDEDDVAMVVRAGNAVVPLLVHEASYSAEEASRCIEALVGVGTRAAMEVIVDYARVAFESDPRNKVSQAIGKGWDVFDRAIYLDKVFSQLQYLYLGQTQVSDVSPLSTLSQLQSLYLGQTRVSDVSPLSALSQLQYLSLSQTRVSDVLPLSSLSQLQYLSLSQQTQVSDVSPLSALSQLQYLHLSQTQVSDVLPLSSLSQLQSLYLDQTQVSDVSPLSALSQLKSLYLDQTQVSDVSPLSVLSQLQDLYLHQTQVSDVSPLSSLSQLQDLSLSQTQVSDVSPLSSFSQLQSLYLSQTQVSDVSPLSSLSQLQSLYLDQTQVSDVSPLSSLSQLQSLSLSQTQVSDVSPLSTLSQLQYLSLSQTQVSDVSPLSALSQLQYLSLNQTQVSNVSSLSDLSQLQFLALDQTQVSDVSPLKHLKNLVVYTDNEEKAKRWSANGLNVRLSSND